MASSVSSLNNYSNFPLFNFGDMNLLASGMAAMQGKVEQNKANLQNLGTQLSTQFLDNITRDSDKVYFQERLNEALNLVETYANSADLSDNNVAGKLSSKLKEVVDDRVVDAIASTTQRRLETAHIQDLKKNDPEKYSDVNFSVYNKAWENYVNNEDPYSTYNGATYHNYVDNFKTLTSKEFMQSLKDMGIYGEWVQKENGEIWFDYNNKYAGVQDINRLKQAVQTAIGEKGFRQMQINAEYNFGDYQNPLVVENLREQYNNYYSGITESLTSDKQALEKAIKGETNQDRLTQYQSDLENINKTLDEVSKKNFDVDVSTNGQFDPNKYRNTYTSFSTNQEMQQLTGLMYQKPRLIESKVEDIKLQVLKFERDNFEADRTFNFNVQKHEAEMKAKGLDVNGNPLNESGGRINISRGDITQGALIETDKVEIGDNKTYSLSRIEQQKAIDGVNVLVDGAMSKASTIELVNELIGKNIGDLKEVTIAGRVVKITDQNRGQVLTALNKFKTTFIDGTSSIRKTRDAMSSSMQDIVNNAVSHYRANPKDHTGLRLNDENFYFEKAQNGQYEYKIGKLNNSSGKSNYQFLMEKASKSGFNGLSDSEKETLRLYITKGVIADKNSTLNDWEKQQLYASYQEDLYKNLKSPKAVNTMPSYKGVSQFLPGDSVSGEFIGDTENPNKRYKQISTEDARIFRQSGQPFFRSDSGRYYIESQGNPSIASTQDRNYSGIGSGDGWSLSSNINKALKNAKIIAEDSLHEDFRSTNKGSINITASSSSGKNIANYIGVPIPEKAIINIVPVLDNNKPTGKFTATYSITDTKGGSTTTILKTPDGNDAILTDKELGSTILPGTNTIYNSDYGSRAAEVSLGSSAIIRNKDVIASIENELPSEEFDILTNEIRQSVKDNSNVLAYVDSEISKFKNGEYSFKLSNGGVKGDTYKIYMTDKVGNSVPLHDTGKTKLDENTFVYDYLQNKKDVKEEMFINVFLKKQLNIK